METKVTKKSTNYSVSTSNDTFKLEGSFNIIDTRIDSYNVSISSADGSFIGNANYNEFENGLINYNYNTPAEYKADVIELVDASIAGIKQESI